MVFVTLLSCVSTTYGQTEWGIRVNQNTDFFTVTYQNEENSFEEHQANFTRLSVELNRIRENVIEELELFIPQINAPVDHVQFPWPQELTRQNNSINKTSSYSLRYSYTRIIRKQTSAFNVALGAAVNPYYLRAASDPYLSDHYASNRNILGVSLNLVPAVHFNASNHITLVVDCPFKVVDFYYISAITKNPTLPFGEQIIHKTEASFFMQAYTLRTGIMYRVGSKIN